MLVYKRRKGESIVIELPDGQSARVVVVQSGPVNVRIGVDAPVATPVYREEVPKEKRS